MNKSILGAATRIVISILFIVSLMNIPIHITINAHGDKAQYVLPRMRLGGGPVILEPMKNYNPIAYETRTMSIVDRNGNYIEDLLEEKMANATENTVFPVVIAWAARPAQFGASALTLRSNLMKAMGIVSGEGGNITRGPWIHAIVGFSARVNAGVIRALAGSLSKLDIDGDGVVDRLLISLDKEYHALNYWSSRQMGIRPWVWDDLGVNGTNVTVVVLDTGIDGGNSAFPTGKIIYWKDYTGDPNGNYHDTPYDDNLHGTHVAGSVAGVYSSFDDQGRFVTNFGIGDVDLSSAQSGYYYRFQAPYGAYYVNATGTIELDFQWHKDSDGEISGVAIAYCGSVPYQWCSPQIVASISTPNENTWYNVTYNVDSSSKFGFYIWLFQVGTAGTVAMLPILRFPVSKDYTGSVPYLAGMAPGAKLGGGKVLTFYGSGSDSDIISGIDDVISNRTSYNPPLYIVSMSFGSNQYDSNLDSAVTNAVNSGIIAVVAAGNSGAGGNYAGGGSPSSNPYAITIAAVGSLNNITDYSSQGGTSASDSNVIKPDIAAPGGGNVLMIFSADTTWHDDLNNWYRQYDFWQGGYVYYEDLDFQDQLNLNTVGYDDSLGISGTSMATPHVSGAAALVLDALLNHAGLSWSWSDSSTVLFAKNILLISAYETYPLEREFNGTDNSQYSPTLDKGGKDIQEGYGALDAYAAVELALSMGPGQALLPGSTVNGTFRDGELYGNVNIPGGTWTAPFGHSVWASRVVFPVTSFTLENGTTYKPTYGFGAYIGNNDPSHTDIDLYLYDLQGNNYGEPIILANSTQGFGYNESFTYTPANDGVSQAILAVKRAREDSAGGLWTLSFGPYVEAISSLSNGTTSDTTAWLGNPINIQVTYLPLPGYTASIEIYDNTTGTVLNKTTLPMEVQWGLYRSYANYTYTLPNDPSLAGHQLLVIASINGPSGSAGPVYHSMSIESGPAPIPEAGSIVLAVSIISAALLATIVLFRRRGVGL